MINNITNLLNMFPEMMGSKEEKYHERMRVCYTQIFTSLFSNFLTLFSSLLIAFRIFDLLIHNSKFFKNQKNIKLAKLSSIFICFLMSYIIWLLQMSNFQGYEVSSIKYYLLLSCWVGNVLNYITLGIFTAFIGLMFFVCLRAYMFISQFTENYLIDDNTNESDGEKNPEQIKKAKEVQKKLLLYPITTCVLYLCIILYSIFSLIIKENEDTLDEVNVFKIISIVFYTIPTVSRGFIFAMVYLGNQKIVKQALLDFIFCKYEKN